MKNMKCYIIVELNTKFNYLKLGKTTIFHM